ncbi:MAG: acyltransferase [Thiobacillus sp.]|nr:acyltransferase [Thiobacillus sp.]
MEIIDPVRKPYLEMLSWLRGVAAFFVIISHSVRASEVSYSAADASSHVFIFSILDLGGYSVYLFFALSGCTLYLSSNKHLRQASDIPAFYIKRFFRIWPTFAFSMALYLLFNKLFTYYYCSDRSYWIGQLTRDYTFADILTYLTLTFNFTGPGGLFNGVYWSLPIEFQYYLLLPLCLILMTRAKSAGFLPPLLFGGCLYLIYEIQPFSIDHYELFNMGFSFFGGVLLARYYTLVKHEIPLLWSSIGLIFVFLITGLIWNGLWVVPDDIPFISTVDNVCGVAALVTLAIALLTRVPAQRNKATALLHRYGDISYSIYLFHMIFIGLAVLAVIKFNIFGELEKLAFIFLTATIGSYYFSIISHRYLELPSMEIGRKISRKLRAHI